MNAQERIISDLGVVSSISPAAEVARRVDFLVEYAKSVPGCRGFVLGISGGQDSTLAGRLCQLAAERMREDGEEFSFVGIRLPYGEQFDEDDALAAMEFIAPDSSWSVNIKPSVDAAVQSIESAGSLRVSDFNKGNIKARVRMTIQYAVAGDLGLLVVGSDHAAEAVTGFFTKFGDGAADLMPLSGLTKSQGAQMLAHLGSPERLWAKEPTADLLDDAPGMSDEEALGVSYRDIDGYLTGQRVSDDAAARIEHLYRVSEHKRKMPAKPSDWGENE